MVRSRAMEGTQGPKGKTNPGPLLMSNIKLQILSISFKMITKRKILNADVQIIQKRKSYCYFNTMS